MVWLVKYETKQIKIIYSLKSVHFLREVVLYPLQLTRKHRLVIVQDSH